MKIAIAPVALLLLSGSAEAGTHRPTFEELGRACVPIKLDLGCSVDSVGFFNDAPGGGRLYWQIQQGASGDDGVGGGIVLLREDGDRLRPVLHHFEASRYEQPRWRLDEDGVPLLILSGTSGGTSASPMAHLYRWDDARWRPVDLDQWMYQVPGMADGLTIQSGVEIDFEQMRAVTPLWRDREGHCCPSGGWARLRFEIRNDVLHLTELRHTP